VNYNAPTTLSGVPVMVIAHVKPIAITYAMFVNPFATNGVKTAQIHTGGMLKLPGLIQPRKT